MFARMCFGMEKVCVPLCFRVVTLSFVRVSLFSSLCLSCLLVLSLDVDFHVLQEEDAQNATQITIS